jgi:insulysin
MRDHLLNFHKKWYSSNIMHLVILGNSPIADLEKWTTEKFSEIKNFDVEVPVLGEPHPFPAGKLGKLIKFVPIQDEDILRFFWTLPICQDEWKSKPLHIISHLLGHEGENSLLSYLKQRGLALKLSCGPDHEMNTFSTLDVSISLSEKGIKEYETVVEAVF